MHVSSLESLFSEKMAKYVLQTAQALVPITVKKSEFKPNPLNYTKPLKKTFVTYL